MIFSNEILVHDLTLTNFNWRYLPEQKTKVLWYNKVIGNNCFINLVFLYKVYIYVPRILLKNP